MILNPTLIQCQEWYSLTSINIDTRDYIEESAVPYDGGIIFISNRLQSALRKITDQNGNALNDIFYSRQKDNKKWSSPDEFAKIINSKADELSVSIDKKTKNIYFTRLEPEGNTAIYMSKYNGKEWESPTLLPFNLRNYNFFDPFVTDDGKRLFFASNRPGGQGGSDIWVSNLGRSGWGPPKNLGPTVNSDTSDVTPFMHSNGKLYFASSRKGTIGGLDIFWTIELNGIWLPVKHLLGPVNTKYNDYSYVSDSIDRNGFISSDRAHSPDIFSFNMKMPVFDNPKPIEKNTYKYRFSETSVISDSSTFIYEWDFGDSTKLRGRILDVVHKFPRPGDYMVVLNVVDSLTGEVNTNQAANVVQVRDEIQPVITCPDSVYIGDEVSFETTKSYLPEMKNPVFYWDFGDGDMSKGSNIKHIYAIAGKFRVVLGASGFTKENTFNDFVCVYKYIIVLDKKKTP